MTPFDSIYLLYGLQVDGHLKIQRVLSGQLPLELNDNSLIHHVGHSDVHMNERSSGRTVQRTFRPPVRCCMVSSCERHITDTMECWSAADRSEYLTSQPLQIELVQRINITVQDLNIGIQCARKQVMEDTL